MPALQHPLLLVIDAFEAELVWALFSFFYFFYFPPEARLGAKLGLAMQREVQAAASLHRFVLIWEGARSPCFVAGIRPLSLFLLQQHHLIFSCKSSAQK